jgi:L-iditol 2-dehydrogenase
MWHVSTLLSGTGTYADYLVKPDRLLLKVPDSLSLRRAALACCGLGPGLNANERLGVGRHDTVIISGCGPVGLGSIVSARRRGARVVALEPIRYRAALARWMGADAVIDPLNASADAEIREALGGTGATCGIETSGRPEAAAHVLSVIEPLGRLALLAWDVPVNLPPIVPRGVQVHGCWHWNHVRLEKEMWATLDECGESLEAMVTHDFPLEEVSAAMDLQESGACGKVLLHAEDGADT